MNDPILRPPHYMGKVECIDAIRSFLGDEVFVGFCLGQVMKYIWRSGKKGEAKPDLEKARFYLDMALGDEPR